MQPQDLIRAAAEIIKTSGWHQHHGDPPISHACDHNGEAVSLFGGMTGDTSRAGVNSAAVGFSIYGALVKAQANAGSANANPGLMWDTLQRVARAMPDAVPAGGTNYVHPIIGYNEAEGRTKAEVLSFLETCALEIEMAAAEAGA